MLTGIHAVFAANFMSTLPPPVAPNIAVRVARSKRRSAATVNFSLSVVDPRTMSIIANIIFRAINTNSVDPRTEVDLGIKPVRMHYTQQISTKLSSYLIACFYI